MRLHTKLNRGDINAALERAKIKKRIAPGVYFATNKPESHGSHTHDHAFEIQLGSDGGDFASLVPASAKNAYGKPQKTRRPRQNGGGGELRFAATWHEWGWFMAEVFAVDPDAMFGNRGKPGKPGWGYDGVADFEEKTNYQFDRDDL